MHMTWVTEWSAPEYGIYEAQLYSIKINWASVQH